MQKLDIENWLKPILKEIKITREISVSKEFFDILVDKLSEDSNFTIIGAALAKKWITVGKWPIAKKKLEISDFYPKKEDLELNFAFQQELYHQFLEIEHKILKQQYREKYDQMCLEWQNNHTPEKFSELVEQNSQFLLEKLKLENDVKDLQKQNADQDRRYAQLFKEHSRLPANYNALITNRLEDVDENTSFEELMEMDIEN